MLLCTTMYQRLTQTTNRTINNEFQPINSITTSLYRLFSVNTNNGTVNSSNNNTTTTNNNGNNTNKRVLSTKPQRWSYHPRPNPTSHYNIVNRIVRVDHSGEYGAQRIYDGQLDALKYDNNITPLINNMREQELVHLRRLNRLCIEYRCRPSILQPCWNIGGYMIGYISGLLGVSSSMTCTLAVENVITSHYDNQLRVLHNNNIQYNDIYNMCRTHRDDEQEHSDIAIANKAKQAPAYQIQYAVYNGITQAAVYVAERI